MGEQRRPPGSLEGLAWASIIATAEGWPADAAEWDQLEQALEALESLGRARLAARDTARRELAEALNLLGDVLGSDRDYFEVADLDTWSADRVGASRVVELLRTARTSIAHLGERNDALAVVPANARDARDVRSRLNELENLIAADLLALREVLAAPDPREGIDPTAPDEPDSPLPAEGVDAAGDESDPDATPGVGSALDENPFEDVPAAPDEEDRLPATVQVAEEPQEPGVAKRPSVDDCVPLEQFLETRVANARGQVVLAPWLDASANFPAGLVAASETAFHSDSFAELCVYGAASTALGRAPYVDPRDLESAVELIAAPESGNSGIDATRTGRLHGWLESGEAGAARVSLALVLEAVRPSLDRPLSDSEIDGALQAASFEDADLAEAIRRLLRLGRTGVGAVDALRVELGRDATAETPSDRQGDLAAARKAFHDEVLASWSGGKGLVRHCREAWAVFIEEHVAPLHDRLKPSGTEGDDKSWPLGELRTAARSLVSEHRVIADRWDAGFKNRRHMDRTAAKIADLAAAVVAAAERARMSTAVARDGGPTLECVRRVVQQARHDGSHERVYRDILSLALGAGAPSRPVRTVFAEVDLARRPQLVGLLAGSGVEGVPWDDGVVPSAFRDPMHAAAILLDDPLPLGDTAPGGWTRASFGALAERALFDQAALLVSAPSIDQREKTSIHRKQDEFLEETRKRFQALAETVNLLDRVASPQAPALRRLVSDARTAVEEDETRAHLNARVLRAWVDEVRGVADAILRTTSNDLRGHAADLPEERATELVAALDEGRYEDAVAQLFPESFGGHVERPRETLWRDEAARTYPNPLAALRGDPTTLGLGARVAAAWQANPRVPEDQRALRRDFFDFVSGDANDSRRRRRRAPGTPAQLRSIENGAIRIHSAALREVLTADGPNPTFVPQVRDTSDVVIASLFASSVKPKELALAASRVVTDARSSPHDIVVLLAPRLPAEARREILRHFRESETRAVVLDDLDLCRLIGPGGDTPRGFLGLVEIALEQLRWSQQISPFRVQDGRNTSLDMFVGRAASADALANQNRYTRLFSGRKLGKSALLKYIELRFDREALPSGNTLRVISVVAAGGEDEEWLVDEIASALTIATGFAPGTHAGRPGDRLTAMLGKYLAEHESESLLVVVDEADQFVEQQLAEYERHSEGCLSFRMMKALPKMDDSAGLPRVRFVFAGYRVTNTNRGAWANAGDVLRIEPLEEAEAVKLIAGPLARLGIDADEQARHIARRCGYQPAVLLKFGSELLVHLRMRHRATGDRLVVTADDVTRTYDSEVVQHEIRTVVQNNFQMNDIGAAVFGAFLLVLSDMPAAAAIRNPGDEIVERLREVGGDLSWLMSENQSPEREVERNLRDFVARGLVVEVDLKDGARGYRLRFPHQLATLVSDDLRRTIIGTIGQAKSTGLAPRRAAGLLPRRVLDEITEMRSSVGRELGCRAVVVAGHWLEALVDDRAGIAARLGFRSADTSHGDDGRDLPVVLDVDDQFAHAFLERGRDEIGLLVGGTDLLRWSIASKETISYGLARLDARRISWWFETRRALQFDTPNAVAEIAKATGGVPLLVGLFNSLIETEDGSAVDGTAYQRALERYGESLDDVVTRLKAGHTAERLSAREIEIFAMAAAVAEISHVIDMRKDLGQAGVVADFKLGDIRPFSGTLDSEDRRAADVLRLSGLLPIDSDLVIHFDGDADPAISIGRKIITSDGAP